MELPTAIEIRNLVKSFGSFRALDDVDLHVGTGQVHGFLGPNGAGKSTTIRVILGLLRHDSGALHLLGGDPWNDAVALHKRLAYVPGDVALWPELTGGETIDLLLRLRGGAHTARKNDLIERLEFDPTKRAGTYSKGNRQKVALIAAFAADVELLIFDEPTSGLDPLMSRTFRDCVAEANARGVTVLLSSHILNEVDALCDHISIIRKGRIIETGTMAELRRLTRTSVVATVERDGADLSDAEGVHNFRRDGNRLTFDVESGRMAPVMAELVALGIDSLTAQPPTLEDLFMRHYERDDEVVS